MQQKHCKPCTKSELAIQKTAAVALLEQIPGWELSADGKAISQKYKFKNYADALAFVQKISEIAEAENHHPDVSFGWGYAAITFTTHAIGGLHMNDFIMATKLNERG